MGSEVDEKLTNLIAMMPFLRQLLGDETALILSTPQQVIHYERGTKIDLGLQAGVPLTPGSVSEAAVNEARKIKRKVPASLMGVPYISTAVPITRDGQVVGVFAMVQTIELEEKLNEISQNMNSSVQTVASGSSGFAASAEELAATSAELANNTQIIHGDVKDMDAIISLIMEIASQTHLLGLNAAIEAARAGDLGRGFNVVAEEIRKLAGRTQSSGKEVTEKLTRIKKNIDALSEHVLQVSAVSQEQAATSEEITASIQQLEPIARDLIIVSAELVK
ncbi:MAG: methyl-accepting chemotaxis protein [Peptococcaceae bacterium]|jgi:hypothetical protein|nr:methyl-accepting chemotaxis protein [Peptococcaceae bacterium]